MKQSHFPRTRVIGVFAAIIALLIVGGLTYIIVVGILLSDHMNAANQQPMSSNSDASAQDSVWYTVKSNDSLWSIAAEQLGNGSAYTAIKELNRDVLKGSDQVKPNMRLRLRARTVSSASAQ